MAARPAATNDPLKVLAAPVKAIGEPVGPCGITLLFILANSNLIVHVTLETHPPVEPVPMGAVPVAGGTGAPVVRPNGGVTGELATLLGTGAPEAGPAPGAPAPGAPASGDPAPGATGELATLLGTGAPASGDPAPGAPAPGAPAPGAPASGDPAPGEPAPGAPGAEVGTPDGATVTVT